MEARELRINNIVMLDETKPVRILWFKLEVACIMEVGKDYPSTIVRLERLSGLPLNEEWSLKLGFEKDESWGMLFIKRPYLVYHDKYLKTNILGVFISGSHREYQTVSKPFNHLHQLQNLFFALKNEELAINHETN